VFSERKKLAKFLEIVERNESSKLAKMFHF